VLVVVAISWTACGKSASEPPLSLVKLSEDRARIRSVIDTADGRSVVLVEREDHKFDSVGFTICTITGSALSCRNLDKTIADAKLLTALAPTDEPLLVLFGAHEVAFQKAISGAPWRPAVELSVASLVPRAGVVTSDGTTIGCVSGGIWRLPAQGAPHVLVEHVGQCYAAGSSLVYTRFDEAGITHLHVADVDATGLGKVRELAIDPKGDVWAVCGSATTIGIVTLRPDLLERFDRATGAVTSKRVEASTAELTCRGEVVTALRNGFDFFMGVRCDKAGCADTSVDANRDLNYVKAGLVDDGIVLIGTSMKTSAVDITVFPPTGPKRTTVYRKPEDSIVQDYQMYQFAGGTLVSSDEGLIAIDRQGRAMPLTQSKPTP
jgi:hypothetical protein